MHTLQVHKVKSENLISANPDFLDGVDDLMQLSYLNEPAVLYNLQHRYKRDTIYVSVFVLMLYLSIILVVCCKLFLILLLGKLCAIQTKAGPVLVAINPFKKVPLYGNDYIEAYKNKSIESPHVYAITDTAIREMIRGAFCV